MIDFHSHVLPEMDDGSRNIEETLEMLQLEYEQGVRKIAVTPHFYAGNNSMEQFLKRRARRFEGTCAAMEGKDKMPKLIAGAEVYYFPGMGSASQISRLCLEGTNMILVEMPFCQWTEDMLMDIQKMIEGQKLAVMLAHVERYYGFQKEKEVWDRMFRMPLYQQLNAGCFLSWKTRRFGVKTLLENDNAVLGSDCHNTGSRPPNLGLAEEVVRKRAGMDAWQQMIELGERILKQDEKK